MEGPRAVVGTNGKPFKGVKNETKAGGENFTIGGDMSFYSWNFNLEKIMKKN